MSDKQDWLILDVSYLAYRAYYAIPGLQHEAIETAVPFGVLRDIKTFIQDFNTENICYCFDIGKGFRENIYPLYKQPRRDKIAKGGAEAEAVLSVKQQILQLRTKYLPQLGIKNIYGMVGYEADDMIALLQKGIRNGGDSVIIVSGDADLYQLLDEATIIWNPRSKKPYNANTLKFEYGVEPKDWPFVKAIAGCDSDNVPGVAGVAEKTAAAYICGRKNQTDRIRKDAEITAWMSTSQYAVNLQLVRLPFLNKIIRLPRPRIEKIDSKQWDILADELGMRSMRGKPPAKPKGFKLGV